MNLQMTVIMNNLILFFDRVVKIKNYIYFIYFIYVIFIKIKIDTLL